MTALLIGLLGFLAVHSIRIVGPDWREARIAAMGELGWKAVYSLLSIAFFVLLVWGYGQARQETQLLWLPPMALRHVGSLLVAIAFVLIVAAYIPRNAIRAKLGHPMILGIKTWALAHLLMSGWLHAVILFAAFLLWAILDFRSARRRPKAPPGPTSMPMTVLTVLLGLGLTAAFALYLHGPLIGVAPFG